MNQITKDEIDLYMNKITKDDSSTNQITKDEINSYINRNKNKCHSLKELASLACLKNDIESEIYDLKIYFSELIEK